MTQPAVVNTQSNVGMYTFHDIFKSQ